MAGMPFKVTDFSQTCAFNMRVPVFNTLVRGEFLNSAAQSLASKN